jgi:glycosyltransferase involved in cell wall biosynthesis
VDRCWSYCIAYNEATLIRYWVRHYRSFCDKVIVYCDLGSDDGTAALARREGAEVRPYGPSGLDDVAFVAFAQEHYREARGHADWVVWTDADEILYHPSLSERLAELRQSGVNYPTVTGYSMMADHPPTGPGQIYDQLQCGFQSDAYSKVCIFDPALDVAWSTGKHTAEVSGAVADEGSDPLRLLHYRWLGEAYFLERNRRNYARLNAMNKAMQHGREIYPGAQGPYSPTWYADRRGIAEVCV